MFSKTQQIGKRPTQRQRAAAKSRAFDKTKRGLTFDLCRRCEMAPANQAHHKRPRGMGGGKLELNEPGNIVALCYGCHDWVERNRESAKLDGWLV